MKKRISKIVFSSLIVCKSCRRFYVHVCLPLYYSTIRMKMIVNSDIDRGINLVGFNLTRLLLCREKWSTKMISNGYVAMALATIVYDNNEIIGEPIIYRPRFLKIRSMPYPLQALSIPCLNYQRQEKNDELTFKPRCIDHTALWLRWVKYWTWAHWFRSYWFVVQWISFAKKSRITIVMHSEHLM